MPNWRVIISAWVPFPEPGAPRRTSRLFTTVLSPVQEDSDAGNKQHGDPNIEPQQRAACCRFAATVRPARKCSPPNPALPQETAVMPLIKLRLDPEITKKENHRRESDVMGPAGGKRAGNPRGCRAISKSILDNCCWEEKQRPGEDDGHHAGIIDFQGHVLRLAPVHFAANYALGILDGN